MTSMQAWKRVAAVAFGVALWFGGPALADTRVALVIGNGSYQNVARLDNPANDAAIVGKALAADGFRVTAAANLDHTAFLAALRAFQLDADRADWAVVYYAGHGLEIAGTNYLIPVDAKLESDRDVTDETVTLDRVLAAVEGAKALRLIILDACRNNPFLSAMKRSTPGGRDIGRGLALVAPGQGTLVAYSAAAGTIASDGAAGNSPFASSLAQHLAEPGVEIRRLFGLVTDDVLDATDKRQQPFTYGSLSGRQDFFFVPPSAAANGNNSGTRPVADPTAADFQSAATVGSLNAWDAFLAKHGSEVGNFYVTVARETRQRLALAPASPDCDRTVGPDRVVGIAANDVLWMRASPDPNAAKLLPIPPDAAGVGIDRCVPVEGYTFPWCQVRFGCRSGWSYSRYLADSASTAPSSNVAGKDTYRVVGVATDDVLNVRQGAGPAFPLVAAITPVGRGISIQSCSSATAAKWCRIVWQDKTGWVSASFLASEQTGQAPE